MVLFFRDSNERIYDSTILKPALFTHPYGQHIFVEHPFGGGSGARALCWPAPFWEQPLGWHSPGGQSFHLSQSQERGLAYQGQRTNPFPVNFVALSPHMFSSPDSHLPATLRAAHSVPACILSLWPKEVSVYAFIGSLMHVIATRQHGQAGPTLALGVVKFHTQKPCLFFLSSLNSESHQTLP